MEITPRDIIILHAIPVHETELRGLGETSEEAAEQGDDCVVGTKLSELEARERRLHFNMVVS